MKAAFLHYRNEVHVIVDEVYGLSTHDENTEFRSVLALDLPDPNRTHVIWSMSKVGPQPIGGRC